MLGYFQAYQHPPRNMQNAQFWKQIHYQDKAQNKNQLNELLQMFFI